MAKGLYDQNLLDAIESYLQSELESKGARIRDFYYCTAAKSENHPWRKPAPGMIFAAQEEHHLNLEGACFIGDKWSDVECAVRAGLKPILVLSGVTRPDQWKNWAHQPVEVYENLLEAANALIL